ncbi:helix-turn-helix domain-containing protein [Caldifermentibacillus hisashii]|uniref:AraC family transcriptional regulator n=1 Tax=Caldifermentibacillus hisashii TaxID=996558 RepID=UPI0031FD38B2
MNKKVIELLKEYTPQERAQLIEKKFVDNIPDHVKEQNKDTFKILNTLFYNNKEVYVSKHNRFSDYPLHSHQFLEINYVLSGQCTQIVEGRTVTLSKGDIILLDIGCSHSIKALSEEDLMVNIIFGNRSINIQWLNDLKASNNIIHEFLLNVVRGVNNTEKYIIYRNHTDSDITVVLEKIIEEYYLNRPFSNTIISNYLTILFTELMRNYHIKAKEKITPHQSLILNILKDIEENYIDISLQFIADKYGYNKNYLGNLIKKQTNYTFIELVTRQKLIKAHTLIISTSMPINDIIYTVGFSSKNFFYDKYKQFYHCLPNESRKMNR